MVWEEGLYAPKRNSPCYIPSSFPFFQGEMIYMVVMGIPNWVYLHLLVRRLGWERLGGWFCGAIVLCRE